MVLENSHSSVAKDRRASHLLSCHSILVNILCLKCALGIFACITFKNNIMNMLILRLLIWTFIKSLIIVMKHMWNANKLTMIEMEEKKRANVVIYYLLFSYSRFVFVPYGWSNSNWLNSTYLTNLNCLRAEIC